jgi:hypothetical protein
VQTHGAVVGEDPESTNPGACRARRLRILARSRRLPDRARE